MKKLLTWSGFVVSEAGTLAEARELIRHLPNWVFLDLMLPDGHGIELLVEIREKQLPVKVCVISACHDDRLEEARARGAEAVLAKPVMLEKLLECIGVTMYSLMAE